MNYLIYILIFFSKILENALATLRLIVVANGKKTFGAFLQLIIAIIWILVTGSVVIDIKNDPLKIIFFGLGSFIGSYVGSYIEEKIALGNNMIMVIIDKIVGRHITSIIRKEGYVVTTIDGEGMLNKKTILIILISRKKRPQLIRKIKRMDKSCLIVSENAFII